jgi:hypothetical protein
MKHSTLDILIIVVCSIAAISLSFIAYHSAFERVSIYGWREYAHQIGTVVLGCAALVATINIIANSNSASSIASLLPLASLPALMGIVAMTCEYRAAYHVCYTASLTPRFDGLASAHVHALSYLILGLAAAFPAFVAISTALFVRTCTAASGKRRCLSRRGNASSSGDCTARSRGFGGESESMRKVNATFVVVITSSLMLIALLVLAHRTALAHATVYGWGGYAFEMITVAIGCAAFAVAIRTIMDAEKPSSCAWLLPFACVPTGMGVLASVWNYVGIYYVYAAISIPPIFSDIANAYDHALSYLIIGLASTFPPFITIGIALYLRIGKDQ